MHPVLGVLASIGVLVGMHISWKIGWHLDDWVSKIFSYRVRATDTHLVFESWKSRYHVEEDPNEVIVETPWLTHNEIRDMKWGVEKRDYDDCERCDVPYVDNIKHLTRNDRIHELTNEQIDSYLDLVEEVQTKDSAEIETIRKDLETIQIVMDSRNLENNKDIEKFIKAFKESL